MALADRQVQYAQDGGVRIGRVVDTVVDPNSGVAAQRERVGVVVPTKNGGTAIAVGERFKAVKVHVVSDTGNSDMYVMYGIGLSGCVQSSVAQPT